MLKLIYKKYNHEKEKICIIGGGLTGLIAAIALSKLNFNIDLVIDPPAEPGELSVGFAKIPITPQVTDTWNDFNGNARYEPEQGETYNDVNDNNKFDPIWIAGFHNRRPAQGVHDDLWARVMVIDDGATRVAIASIDAVGFIYDDAVDIRKSAHGEINCEDRKRVV